MHALQVLAARLCQWGPCVAWDSQDRRASWGPRVVAWESLTPEGFVGAMRCMGLDHTAGLAGGIRCGPTDTSSLKLQGEVGGWRWLSGVRCRASLKTDSQSGSVSTSSPRHCSNLVPRHSTCQYQLLHCIPRPCSRSCPIIVAPSSTNIAQPPHVCGTVSPRNNLAPTLWHHQLGAPIS